MLPNPLFKHKGAASHMNHVRHFNIVHQIQLVQPFQIDEITVLTQYIDIRVLLQAVRLPQIVSGIVVIVIHLRDDIIAHSFRCVVQTVSQGGRFVQAVNAHIRKLPAVILPFPEIYRVFIQNQIRLYPISFCPVWSNKYLRFLHRNACQQIPSADPSWR